MKPSVTGKAIQSTFGVPFFIKVIANGLGAGLPPSPLAIAKRQKRLLRVLPGRQVREHPRNHRADLIEHENGQLRAETLAELAALGVCNPGATEAVLDCL